MACLLLKIACLLLKIACLLMDGLLVPAGVLHAPCGDPSSLSINTFMLEGEEH